MTDRPTPLPPQAAQDVLRYWLASLRLEEALAARPRARRTARNAGDAAVVPRLAAPTPGQDYFKLPLRGPNRATTSRASNQAATDPGPKESGSPPDGAGQVGVADVVCRGEALMRPFDPELCAFFEHDLYRAYRSQDDDDAGHLLCFPVVHLPRGELAGPLRMRVKLRFPDAAGEAFKLPKTRRGRARALPPPPVAVELERHPREPEDWPFFLDTRVLHRQLGFDGEAIDQLFDSLRACETMPETRMLALVIRALERQRERDAPDASAAPGPPADRDAAAGVQRDAAHNTPQALLDRLTSLVAELTALHAPRAKVFPYAIVMGAGQAKTTWHLQRDIQGLLRARPRPQAETTPLQSYLTGAPLPVARDCQRALCTGPALTAHQLRVAEHVWGSPLSAVQGPPGTGKTTLIQHLCAEFLVRKMEKLLDDEAPDPGMLVIASSNNRAVDNALEELESDDPERLPLSLRAGSRKVVETRLAEQLQHAATWLERQTATPKAARQAALDTAKARFAEVRDRIAPQLQTKTRVFALERRRGALRRELEALPAAPDDEQALTSALRGQLDANAMAGIAALEGRLLELSDLCELPASVPALRTVARHFERTKKKHLAACEDALRNLGVRLELPPDLPPSSEPRVLLDAWQEAAETALAQLHEAAQRARRLTKQLAERQRRASLQTELEALQAELDERNGFGAPSDLAEPADAQDAASEVAEADARALYRTAVALREAWAGCQAELLLPAVQEALHLCREQRSLKPMPRDNPEGYDALQRLFGLWGCTLLSLGNCFPASAGTLSQLIIDEAGQCHPAHAVGGLLRCRAALLIGDVHQLTPVVQLSPDDDLRLLGQLQLDTPVAQLAPYRVHAESHSSAQSLADRAAERPLRLVDHFRCQPEIIAVSDALCGYGLTVHTQPHSRAAHSPLLCAPVAWLETRGPQERMGGSWCNPAELEVVFATVEALLSSGIARDEIAIITPYRGQLERLRRGFNRRGIPLEASVEMLSLDQDGPDPAHDRGRPQHASSGLAVGTVHRFQGGERSIVLFSSVVSRSQSLPFLNQRPNLLNVAISRARHHFLGIGQRQLLSGGPMTGILARAAQHVPGPQG